MESEREWKRSKNHNNEYGIIPELNLATDPLFLVLSVILVFVLATFSF